MKKYTQEQKISALKLFEEGFSAREIFEELEIPVGTLNRWKSEQDDAEGIESLRLRVKDLEERLTKIEQINERNRRSRESENYDVKSTSLADILKARKQ